MDTADLEPLVDELKVNIDDLQTSLAPLLQNSISQSTSKLPLLDKAKAYVLTTYAIESILFSYLRLNGVDAKTHPIFQELTRVKEYFAKIKAAETGGAKRSTTLDREAANRFIRHGLAGNERFDRERAERSVSEKAGAKRKLEEMHVGTHTRFDGAAKRIKAEEEAQAGDGASSMTAHEEDATTRSPAGKESRRSTKKHKEQRLAESGALEDDDGAAIGGNRSTHIAGSAVQISSPVIAGTTADEKIGDLDTTPSKKKKKSRRKKAAEKIENGRAEEMK